jgi:hypothetical protein
MAKAKEDVQEVSLAPQDLLAIMAAIISGSLGANKEGDAVKSANLILKLVTTP